MIVEPAPIMSDGLRLWGEIHRPEGAGSVPAVLVCHGLPAGPPDPTDRGYAELADRWAAAGLATLIFSFRGAGASAGDFGIAGWVRDARAALDYLAARPFVDARRIALIGFSAGAFTGSVLAAEDPRVAAFAGCAGPAAIRRLADPVSAAEFLDHARRIGIIRTPGYPASIADWCAEFRAIRPVEAMPRIAPRPVLIVHGEADDVVPVEDARTLYNAARNPKTLMILPGAGHRLRVEPGAMDAVLDWLRPALAVPGSPGRAG